MWVCPQVTFDHLKTQCRPGMWPRGLEARQKTFWELGVMKIIRSAELEFVPASHEDPESPGVLKKVLLEKHDLLDGKVQMVNWALLPVGRSFEPHYHENMEEVFIMIHGFARIAAGKTEGTIGPGDAVVIPVGVIHMMENLGEEHVEYIAIGISKGQHGRTVTVRLPGDSSSARELP
jgi:mannose-6-phosphate isomerase-like protein (cupin superfamily)